MPGKGRDVTWYKMGDKNFPLTHNRVRQLYEDRDGYLWVATDGSISRYDEESRQFIPYSIVDSTRRYNTNWAYGLFEDKNGKLWVATCLGGIFVVDKHKLLHASTHPYVAEEPIPYTMVCRVCSSTRWFPTVKEMHWPCSVVPTVLRK